MLRGHENHSHQVGPSANRGPLLIALLLITGFMAAEVVAGIVGHSLALLSDAGHMVTDAGALLLSLVAIRLAARPPSGGLTYGLRRAEILSALANGITLIALAAVIAYEAVRRLLDPAPASGRVMLAVAIGGAAVNLLATWQLARADRRSLNVRGAFQHVLTDLFAFAATAVAAIVILATGLTRADPLASLFVAVLMVRAGDRLVRDAARVLLEATPAGLDGDEVARALAAHPLVVNVHDFHLWEITSGMPALSAHVLVRPREDCHEVRRDLERALHQRFDIVHTTLQVDHATDPDARPLIKIDTGRAAPPPRLPG